MAQRCTDVVSRYLYGQALTTAAANGNVEAADSGEVIRLLLEHQPDSQITADVVLDLIGKRWNRSEMEILKVLVECGKTAEFTAEIRKALDEELQSESQQETKELFYKLEREHI